MIGIVPNEKVSRKWKIFSVTTSILPSGRSTQMGLHQDFIFSIKGSKSEFVEPNPPKIRTGFLIDT